MVHLLPGPAGLCHRDHAVGTEGGAPFDEGYLLGVTFKGNSTKPPFSL